MDEQIRKTIDDFWSELRDIKTDDFYKDYLELCEQDGVKPRAKNIVIREACEELNLTTKQKHITYTVFCEK